MNIPSSPGSETTGNLLNRLETSSEGLSALDAENRFRRFGANGIREEERSKISLFIGQFASPIVWILLTAALISFTMGHNKDGVIILAVLTINAFLGFYQELKAETSIRALQKLTESHAKVLRSGIDADPFARTCSRRYRTHRRISSRRTCGFANRTPSNR